ncbi:DPL1 (YDR294C) [Zygosaccharomyces parabailii]|nr:DPL1 (YDR294C) [Zygosaccharomyces parabailii]CDH10433.1 probable Sphingosine-1-phosphate lyase [Zygosaccharomyces bailii ISA1307]
MDFDWENAVEHLRGADWQQSILYAYDYVIVYFATTSWIGLLRDYLLVTFIYKVLCNLLYYLKAYGIFGSVDKIYHELATFAFTTLINSPFVKPSVDKEVKKVIGGIERDLILHDDLVRDFETLPQDGLSEKSTLEELDKLQENLHLTDWRDGKVSGAVYHGGKDLIHLQSLAFEKYCVANQLHPDVFPAVRKMESEVVAMVLDMFHAPKDTGCGTTSSGGTESLLLACLSAKVYGYHHRGITEPEIVVPVTAHAGINKAAYYFGITLRNVEVDPVTYKVDLKKAKRLINKNTVLLVGSAPNFPHGIVDDIEGLSRLAIKYGIPLHVDCCLGSFIVAFMHRAGFQDLPAFDFRVPGVTSISCDTHKYGFAPKGSSVIMYRNPELRAAQYYVSSDWTGGLYGSPTLAGSRPGALVVGCWATMVHIGKNGYTESCREIVNAARKLRDFIRKEVPELRILGDPLCSVVSFSSDELNVYELGDKLTKLGWHLSSLQKPPALHLAVTKPTVDSIDELASTLKKVVGEMNKTSNKGPVSEGTSAIYGVAGSVKTRGVADKLIVGFLDTLYKLEPQKA